MTANDLSFLLGRTKASIHHRASQMDLVKPQGYQRRYVINEEYFSRIDSFDKSYFLGLIWADGTVSNNLLQLSFKEPDKSLLEKFNYYTESSYPIHTYKHKNKNHANSCMLKVTSKPMCQDLKNYGIIPRKTYGTSEPVMPAKYGSHFLRGLIDGDGHISSRYNAIKVTNTEVTCNWICKFLQKEIGIKGSIRKENHAHAYVWYIGGRQQCKSLINFLYTDSEGLYLPRKYNVSKEII